MRNRPGAIWLRCKKNSLKKSFFSANRWAAPWQLKSLRGIQAGGLIIMSSFTSIPELAGRLYPFLPVRWLSKFRYATIDKIGAITAPKLIIHSPDDEIIPFAHGQGAL